MSDESICYFMGVGSILSLLFYFGFLMVTPVSKHCRPHYVASDLALHCLPMTLYSFPGKSGLIFFFFFFFCKTGFSPVVCCKEIPG